MVADDCADCPWSGCCRVEGAPGGCGGAGTAFDDWSELNSTFHQLEKYERQAVIIVAKRLLFGQRTYGIAKPAQDRRDWLLERGQELADAEIYLAFETLARMGR
jgi:hypothetical protein